jgi:hypothetical protein
VGRGNFFFFKKSLAPPMVNVAPPLVAAFLVKALGYGGVHGMNIIVQLQGSRFW